MPWTGMELWNRESAINEKAGICVGSKIWKILAVAEIVLAIAIIATIAAVGECPNQIETAAGGTVPMKCHWTFLACDVMSVVAIVCGLLAAFSKGEEARRVCAIACIALFLAIIAAVNFVMGVCTGETSICRTTTGPIVTVISATGIVVGLVMAVKPGNKRLPKAHL